MRMKHLSHIIIVSLQRRSAKKSPSLTLKGRPRTMANYTKATSRKCPELLSEGTSNGVLGLGMKKGAGVVLWKLEPRAVCIL